MLIKMFKHPSVKLGAQIVGLIAFIVLLVLIRNQLLTIITPFIVALVIAYILNPVVLWLQRHKIKRILSVLIIYLVFFGLIFVLISQLLPVVISEVDRLAGQIPRYTSQAQDLIRNFNEATDRMELPESVQDALDLSLRNLERSLVDTLTRIPELTGNLARAIFNIVLILILTFYLLKDFSLIKDTLQSIVPHKSRSRARKILHEIDHSLGNYIRGQLLICSIIGFSSYLGLLFLGVEFALILGIIAGITNIIPYFGPFIGAIPAIIVAILQSPALALKVAIVFTIIQQVESHLIAPQILGKSMGLHPVVVIMALIAGGQFFGILGMIVAVPVVAVVRILVRNLILPPVDSRS